jgi:hypothetical protein
VPECSRWRRPGRYFDPASLLPHHIRNSSPLVDLGRMEVVAVKPMVKDRSTTSHLPPPVAGRGRLANAMSVVPKNWSQRDVVLTERHDSRAETDRSVGPQISGFPRLRISMRLEGGRGAESGFIGALLLFTWPRK